MAIYEMDAAGRSQAPVLHFQKIHDAILAFWGCVDDQIDDENTRNIIKNRQAGGAAGPLRPAGEGAGGHYPGTAPAGGAHRPHRAALR